MNDKEKKALADARRPGWIITGRRPETERVQQTDATGNTVTVTRPTGNIVWTIASPDGGQTDEITVTPPPTIGAGTTDADARYAASQGFNVVKGPTHEVPTPSSANSPSAQNEAALNAERENNAATSKWGRVTNAERAALEQRERQENRQLSNDEINQTLAQAREDRAQRAEDRAIANQAESNAIARARLDLERQQANRRQVAVVDNQLVDKDTGQVIYTAPQGTKFQTAQDGTILAIDPANPSNVQVIWSPEKPAEILPGQRPDQPNFIQRDPRTGALTSVPNPIAGQGQPTEVSGQQGPTILLRMPDGSYRAVPNPAYRSTYAQAFQEQLDGINQVEGMLSRGEISVTEANQYKDLLHQKFQATLQGTTPYQIQQDQRSQALRRMETGQALLNQRVSSGAGLAQNLLNSAVGIVGNRNFMDPSAVAGFSPFAGAANYVTELGGGPGVYEAAANAVRNGIMSDPATSLLTAALSAPAAQPQMIQPAPAPQSNLLPPGMTGTAADPLFAGAFPGSIPQPPITQDPAFLNDQRHFAGVATPADILLAGALGGGGMSRVM